MINKLLVANRGEIARRIFRTCRAMGISTVAVYSVPDADAPFVLEADEAVPLGGSAPADSYLRGDSVIEAARRVGADAIHPGYGFLSENADFAKACQDAGIVFVGPGVDAIEAMGSKLTARDLMEGAGVPVLPGRDLTGVPDEEILALAEAVGWPVLVKASFGGGGRGMRVVREPDELVPAIESARREAGSAFGNDTVFLEHYVDEPRHVEIQIFGDTHGTIVHLNERECSVQRRHQKIIEESPSPAVDEALRYRMGEAAVQAGKALAYVGAGTVEFLLAPDGDFYFLEVNTRLQVEHPVTELVTGLDLVRLQLEVADGKPLPPEAVEPGIAGHAIEARLYAEDPNRDFLPAAGRLVLFEVPQYPGIRVDSGVESGDEISTSYDPMLAKIIAYGATRDEARMRLAKTLRRTKVHGLITNRALLVGILENERFAAGAVDTHFLDRADLRELSRNTPSQTEGAAVLAATMGAQAWRRESATALRTISSGFRNVRSQLQTQDWIVGDREVRVGYLLGREQHIELDGEPVDVELVKVTPDLVDLVSDGVRRRFELVVVGDACYASCSEGTVELMPVERFPSLSDHDVAGSLVAPMPATVVRVPVVEGEHVSERQTVVVIEAMKMEHAITAPTDSTVVSIPVSPGDAVENGALLVVLESDESVQEGLA